MANWKKVIVSGSNAELNQITGSQLQLNDLPGSTGKIPLVIDANGNISTGSQYATSPGGGDDTVGGSNLTANVAIVGNGSSTIKSASSAADVDFNNANLKNITNLTASNIAVENIYLGTSTLHTLAFKSSSNGTLQIPAGFGGFEISIPVTMSSVPGGSTETKVLMLDANGRVVTRSSSDIGGVTGVNGGTNISVNQSTGGVTASLDSNISLTSITASAGLFFTSSGAGPKHYRIDYAKVNSGSSSELELSSGSLTITASGVQIKGDLEASGSVTLDGALSFNGFNFTQTSITNITGSQNFGSGSDPADLDHKITGSLSITGSNLTLVSGTLSIPGFPNVSASLATLGVASNLVSNTTFNNYTQSINSSISALNTETGSINSILSALNTETGSISASISALNTETGSINSSISALNIKTGSIDTSITNINSVLSALNTETGSISASISALNTFTGSNDNTAMNTALSFDNTDVTVQGNLTVLGNTTTLTTQDLIVEDRFIIIGSGSGVNDDVGIVFSSGSDVNNKGRGIIYDASAKRFTTAKEVDSDHSDIANINDSTHTGDIVTVKANQSTAPSGSASSSFGEGEMYIHNGDIYIYID